MQMQMKVSTPIHLLRSRCCLQNIVAAVAAAVAATSNNASAFLFLSLLKVLARVRRDQPPDASSLHPVLYLLVFIVCFFYSSGLHRLFLLSSQP